MGNATASFSVDSTISRPDSTRNRLLLLLPHPFMSLLASSAPHFQLLLLPGQQAIQKAVAEQQQAVSCQVSGRERERGRKTFQSVKKALLVLSNQPWPPLPSPLPTSSQSLQREKKAGHEKYTVRGQLLLVIMGCLWLG